MTMTSYPAVRKTAHHAPALAELEFCHAQHTLTVVVDQEQTSTS
jgi:hypothetical protein